MNEAFNRIWTNNTSLVHFVYYSLLTGGTKMETSFLSFAGKKYVVAFTNITEDVFLSSSFSRNTLLPFVETLVHVNFSSDLIAKGTIQLRHRLRQRCKPKPDSSQHWYYCRDLIVRLRFRFAELVFPKIDFEHFWNMVMYIMMGWICNIYFCLMI